jgi:ribosomal protein S18 acetylase RimI-like enzyme
VNRVRRATNGDLPAIEDLTRLLQVQHAAHYPELFHRGHMGPYFERILGEPDHAVFVAERSGEVIGVAIAELMDEKSPNCHPMRVCRLNSIVVGEAARGSGAGRALIEAVEHFAREAHVSDIRLAVADFNEPAIAVYEHLGYKTRIHVMGKFIGKKD